MEGMFSISSQFLTPSCVFGSNLGSTTGGNGGTITTVSTLAQFTAAVTDDTVARIIIVQGTITGAQRVRIGSNKSLIGLPGASKPSTFLHSAVGRHSNNT